MKLNASLILFLSLVVFSAAGQITDEELKKYGIAMDSIETLKNQLTIKINNLTKGSSKISSDRFNTLMPIINNEPKLKEVGATPDEISYVKKSAAIRNEETLKFQQTYQSLINDYVGANVFTKVRNGLKSDASLKKRYDSLMVKPIRQ